MKKGEMTNKILMLFLVLTFISPLISAGVGIRIDKETSLVPENEKTCLTYGIYNPFDSDVYTLVQLTGDVEEILTSAESETKFIPGNTMSVDAIPVTFCFKTKPVYERDCLIGNFFCSQNCSEEMKLYSGEVEAIQLTEEDVKSGGAGGSATKLSISSPLKVKVQCIPHGRDFTLVYALVALIAGALLVRNVLRKRKNKGNSSKKKDKKKN